MATEAGNKNMQKHQGSSKKIQQIIINFLCCGAVKSIAKLTKDAIIMIGLTSVCTITATQTQLPYRFTCLGATDGRWNTITKHTPLDIIMVENERNISHCATSQLQICQSTGILGE